MIIRGCRLCGQILRVREYLCQFCWRGIHSFQNHGVELFQNGYPFQVFSLFPWDYRSDELIRELVQGLKGESSYELFLTFAERFHQERLKLSFPERQTLLTQKRSILIPAPAKYEGQRDHALSLALALGHLAEIEVKPCLLRKNLRSQKKLKKKERQEVQIELNLRSAHHEKYSQSKRVIFVDDVITTGATVKAAHRALGFPPSFEVWTLVRRMELAPHRKN